jgi:hypothetical protein
LRECPVPTHKTKAMKKSSSSLLKLMNLAAPVTAFILAASVAADPGRPSATGSGTATFPFGFRNFAFSAVTHADGSVTGQAVVRLHHPEIGGLRRIQIDCLRVEGNVAIMSGIITEHTADPDLVGLQSIFIVVDNGQGKNSPPDEITITGTYDIPGITCANFEVLGIDLNGLIFLLGGTFPIEGGNIQVRP